MFKKISRYKKVLKDFLFCIIAYALPVFVIQFLIQPLVAKKIPLENGLHLALYSAVKLLITIFIVPLANFRLLQKQQCNEDKQNNKLFNFLFLAITTLCLLLGVGLTLLYYNVQGHSVTFIDVLYLSLFIILVCIHDFYSIEYRLDLNYLKIIFDNVFIVLGYIVGILLFNRLLEWEYIFILGYLFGVVYVLITTKIWRAGLKIKIKKDMFKDYSQLSFSSALTNTTTYLDKLIIYPVLGEEPVGIYNAAAVVSKAISIVTTPLRNVLLSYIVANNEGTIKKSVLKKGVLISVIGTILIYAFFLLFSVLMCKFLYSQYFSEAVKYIPLIVGGIILETYASILNIVVMRFAKYSKQLILSAIKLTTYISMVVVLAIIFKMGLVGFCISLLVTAIVRFITVILSVKNCIKFI